MTCPHLERCAGCPLMHLPLEAQRVEKQSLLARAFRRHSVLRDLVIPDVVAAEPSLGYRTRLKWMVERNSLGMYGRDANHRVVDTPECLVASPLLLEIAKTLRGRVAELGLDAMDLREAQTADGPRVLVTLVVPIKDSTNRLQASAEELCLRHPEIVGVAENVRGRKNPQILGQETSLLRGVPIVQDRLDRAYVLGTFGSFVQAHRGQARALADAMAQAALEIASKPRVLELFGGSGAFGLELAARGMAVDLVESFAPAAALARRAATEQRLPLTAHSGDATHFATQAALRRERYDVVLVDPPRRGLSAELRRSLVKLNPRLLVYVSCHPTTLARDLEHLAFLGFQVRALRGYDMIPQTDHVETLCFIAPCAPVPLETLWRDAASAVVDRPAFLTDDEVLSGARRSLDWPGASFVKQRTLTSGATSVAKGPGHPPRVFRRALVLAKGVTTRRGDAVGIDFRQLAVVGGHSLLDVAVGDSLDALVSAFAKTGHPVLGAASCDPATSRHFVEKHGLERPFIHVTTLVLPGGESVESGLAGDLAGVLASLGCVWPQPAV